MSRVRDAVHSGALGPKTLRFAVVGAFNTAFGYAVFAGLQLAFGEHLHYLEVLLIAHVVTVLTAFLLYGRFVFPQGDRGGLAELARFWSVYLVCLGLNAIVLLLCVGGLGMPVLVAQLLALAVTASVSFVGHSRFSFRSTRSLAP